MYMMTKNWLLLLLTLLFSNVQLQAQVPVTGTELRLARLCDLEISLSETIPHCDGWEVCIEVTGATLPLIITLDGTPQSNTDTNVSLCIDGLDPGNYTIGIVDAEGCTATVDVALPAIDYYLEVEVDPVSCYGSTDGAIHLNIPIDIAPIFFSWEGPNGYTADTESIADLGAGIYCVSVTTIDDICVGTGCWEVIQPDPIDIEVQLVYPDCGQPDGCVFVSGGSAPYHIWVLASLPPEIADAPYGNLPPLVDLDPTAGAPYDPVVADTAFCASNVANGTYYILVVDSHLCYAWEVVIIDVATSIERTVQVIDPTCGGLNNGSVCFSISNGTPPFFTMLSPSVSNVGITGTDGCFEHLAPGTYVLTTRDGNGCLISETLTLAPPSNLEVHFTITSSACSDQVDGCLYIDGGTPPYHIWVWHWNSTSDVLPHVTFNADGEPIIDGATSTNDIDFQNTAADPFVRCAEDIPAGFYLVLVADGEGCYRLIRVVIPEPGALAAEVEVRHVGCDGDDEGDIKIRATNGLAPYTFVLGSIELVSDDGVVVFEHLAAGTYTIQVYDADQCSATVTVIIEEAEALISNLDFDQYGDYACVDPEGGTPPYAVRWYDLGSNAAIGNGHCIYNLLEGAYLVRIRDAQSCESEDIFFIDPRPCAGGIAMVDPDHIESGESTVFSLIDWSGSNLQWQFRTEFTSWLTIPGATSEVYHTPPLHSGSDKTVYVRAAVRCQDEVYYAEIAELFIEGDNSPMAIAPELADRYLFQPLDYQAMLAKAQANIETSVATVYPTLCNQSFNIRFLQKAGPTTIELYTSLGLKVYEQTHTAFASGEVIDIPTRHLTAGTYFVRISTDNQMLTRRIIVSHD
ncbi:MAG: hypothetical protein DHS20C18_42220 [Saprospiraceae bacterium]|nr:MAG: hypothetical protein DHS20C18_42220 [Saprospiraceae bacterium]